MAVIILGKRRGHTAIIKQWCNDWFSVTVEGEARIASPLMLKLTPDEAALVAKSIADGKAGTMGGEFKLNPVTGTFRRIKPGA